MKRKEKVVVEPVVEATRDFEEHTGRVFDSVALSSDSEFASSINDSFYEDLQRTYDKRVAEKYGDTPDVTSQILAGHIEDVLLTLKIPAHTTIASDVLLPDDVDSVQFEMLAPMGYDTVQVDNFIAQTKMSIETYLAIIKERLVHIAKLASVVDRMQVDINNLRFRQEMSNMVNITTTGDPSLESELLEAKLKVRSLEERLSVYENNDGSSKDMSKVIEDYEGEIAKLRVILEDESRKTKELEARLSSGEFSNNPFGLTGVSFMNTNDNVSDGFVLPDVEEDYVEPMEFGE